MWPLLFLKVISCLRAFALALSPFSKALPPENVHSLSVTGSMSLPTSYIIREAFRATPVQTPTHCAKFSPTALLLFLCIALTAV